MHVNVTVHQLHIIWILNTANAYNCQLLNHGPATLHAAVAIIIIALELQLATEERAHNTIQLANTTTIRLDHRYKTYG